MTENVAVREFVTELINAWNAGIRQGDLMGYSINDKNLMTVTRILKEHKIAVYLEHVDLHPKIRCYEDIGLPHSKVKYTMAEVTDKTISNPFDETTT
jgi:hypothetical protein